MLDISDRIVAFEVYFDITANKKDFDDLLFNLNVLLLLIAVSLVWLF